MYNSLKPQDMSDSYVLDNLEVSRTDKFLNAAYSGFNEAPSIANWNKAGDLFKGRIIDYNRGSYQFKTEEEYRAEYPNSRLDYDPDKSRYDIDQILEKDRLRDNYNYVLSSAKADNLNAVIGFAGEMVGSNITPINAAINVATGLTPVGAVAKGAWWLSNPVKAKATQMAVGGGLGQLALEPFEHKMHDFEERDYTYQDSIRNVATSALFSSLLPVAAHGAKSLLGTGKAKYNNFVKSYMDTPENLHSDYATNNPALDIQLRHNLNELGMNTSPTAYDNIDMSIKDINAARVELFEQAAVNHPEFYRLEAEIAANELALHQQFKTGGDITMLPDNIQGQLVSDKRRLHQLHESLAHDDAFLSGQQELTQANELLVHKLKEDQHNQGGYNYDAIDLEIVTNQLDNGYFIDLDDPKNAKSIYDKPFNADVDIKLKKQIADLEELLSIEQSLKGNLDDFAYRNELLQIKRISKSKEIINQHKTVKHGFVDLIDKVDAESHSISNEYFFKLVEDLRQGDLTHYFTNKNFHKSIRQELWNLTHHRKTDTKSIHAKKVASIIHKLQTNQMKRLSSLGIDVPSIEGYITRQTHDKSKIQNVTANEWIEFINPLLDKDRMDANVNLAEIYDNLRSGIHGKGYSDGGHRDISDYFSSERKLLFKSADASYLYHEKFGEGLFNDMVISNFNKLGYDIGIIDNLTTNPLEYLRSTLGNEYIQDLKPHVKGQNKAQKDVDWIEGGALDRRMKHLLGVKNEVPTLSDVGQNLRNLKNMASLGQVMLTSFTDVATVSFEAIKNGIPIFQSFGQNLKGLTHSLSPEDKKSFGRMLGVGVDNQLGNMYSRLTNDTTGTNLIGTMSKAVMRMTGMGWWDNSHKSSFGLMLSNEIAHELKTGMNNQRLVKNLKRYGITEQDYDQLRKLIKKAEDGNDYVIPEEWSETNHKQNEVSKKLRTFISDRVNTAIITPNAGAKYVANMMQPDGTAAGESIKLLMQYKSFTIALTRNVIMDSWKTGDGSLLGAYVMMAAVGGYLSMSAKALVRGEEAPDINEETLAKSLMVGGALGYFGDFLFHEHNRYGQGFVQASMGAVPSDGFEVASLLANLSEGKVDKASDQAKNLLIRNTPMRNMFWLQGGMRAVGVPNEWVDEYMNARKG